MVETSHVFGPDRNLMGIISHAPGHQAGLGCLLFNAGVLHRIGPHRINVKLARALACAGATTLRMDLSGLGDSAPSRVAISRKEQVLQDLRAGLSLLAEECGVIDYVVIGICSGAVQGHELALADERVSGVLMFDGHVYPTLRTEIIARWRNAWATPWRSVPAKISDIAVRQFQWLRRRFGAADGAAPATEAAVLGRHAFGASLAELTARGVAVRINYSGSFVELYNHPDQFRRTFRRASFLDLVQCAYMPDVDHTFTSLAGQRRFVTATVDWVRGLVAAHRDKGAGTPSARHTR